jgi:hypothetical protein
MKKIEIKKQVITIETKFQANDGTMFNDEKECKIYEESYIALLKADYAKLNKRQVFESDFLIFAGCEDYLLEIVSVNTDEDVELLLKLELYFCSSDRRSNSEWVAGRKAILERAKGGKVIVGRGEMYNGEIHSECFSLFAGFNEYIERLRSFAK